MRLRFNQTSNRNSDNPVAISAIVLAAGQGKRMKSEVPKVLAPVSGQPMVLRILNSLAPLNLHKIALVLGHKGELVRDKIGELSSSLVSFAEQKEQLGTGDAALVGLRVLGEISGEVSGIIIITPGDTPLLTSKTLLDLIKTHESEKATLSLLSFKAKNPHGYGRILREKTGNVLGIKEEKDCSNVEKNITEVNSGIYAVDAAFLRKALETLEPKNAQRELYLTDIVGKAVAEGQHVVAVISENESEFLGVNDHKQLAEVQRMAMNKKIELLLENGVRITNPDSVYIEDAVEVGSGTVLGPNVQILGKSKIGKNVTVEGSAYILDTTIEDGSIIKFSVRTEGAFIGKNSSVGPFAHLRPEARLESDVKVGNFVEIKKSTLKAGAKASHLTYLGDAEVGKDANVGAGTITCNYDGYKKSKTVIGDGAFIGSNTSLVAPVTVGTGAVVGAGSVITKEVPADSLAVERSEQREISGWAKRRRDSNK